LADGYSSLLHAAGVTGMVTCDLDERSSFLLLGAGASATD
jgi:hypothetical protein